MAAAIMPSAPSALGNVSCNGHGLAAGRSDGGDDFICAGLTGGVIDDDGSAFGGERLGDGGSDAFGGAGNDCDFTFELGHGETPLSGLRAVLLDQMR